MRVIIFAFIIFSMTFTTTSCSKNTIERPTGEYIPPPGGGDPEEEDFLLPNIDLSHWKVTLPIGNPTEVSPPEILNYATSELLKPFMYNDSIEGALVFHTYPGATTTNSTYSRTELREQMVAGSNSTNWTFAQGGRMKGTLKMAAMDKDNSGDYYRSIIMQIHGRLTNEQRALIGQSDNNAPPVLKIYWNDGKVRVIRKILKNVNVNDIDILRTDSWTDEAIWLGGNVDFEKFTLEIIASEGRLEVILNGDQSVVWDDIHMQKWGVFENYFKAGNYFQSKVEGTSCTVNYYDLTVSH